MPSTLRPHYRRILLKLSGEALMGSQSFGIDLSACNRLALQISEVRSSGVEVCIVVGGGNIFRGIRFHKDGMERSSADQIGMLATVINGISLQQALDKISCPNSVMSAFRCEPFVERYSRRLAIERIEQNQVMIFVGGTGNPYFTTDSAAVLRALEVHAEIVIKATKVDGVYDKDPLKFPDAVKFDQISYTQVLEKQLEVMDATAIVLCQRNQLPIRVINLFHNDSLKKAICNTSVGTLVAGE